MRFSAVGRSSAAIARRRFAGPRRRYDWTVGTWARYRSVPSTTGFRLVDMGRRFLLLGVMSIVAACGGGGGGDGSGGGGTGAGGGGSFQLTESNALEAGQYALDSIEQALF